MRQRTRPDLDVADIFQVFSSLRIYALRDRSILLAGLVAILGMTFCIVEVVCVIRSVLCEATLANHCLISGKRRELRSSAAPPELEAVILRSFTWVYTRDSCTLSHIAFYSVLTRLRSCTLRTYSNPNEGMILWRSVYHKSRLAHDR